MTTANTTPAVYAARRHNEILTRAFGVEIETVGSTRENIAKHVSAAIPGSTIRQGADYYKSYYVVMADGREWRVMSDASLTGGSAGGWAAKAGEVVSPILTWADMELLQTVVRAVRKARAKVDHSCGIHVHVDGRDLKAGAVGRLVTIVENHDGLIDSMLGIAPARRGQWCKKLPAAAAAAVRTVATAAVNAEAPARTCTPLATAWYGDALTWSTLRALQTEHYQQTRYHGLNLHSLFFRGTVEFRWFNGSLHAGEIKAYVALALGLVSRAIHTTAVRPGSGWAAMSARPKYALNSFFYDLSLSGPAFANVRAHLSRWLNPTVTAEAIEPADAPPVRAARRSRAATVATPAVDATPAPDAAARLDDARAIAVNIDWSSVIGQH